MSARPFRFLPSCFIWIVFVAVSVLNLILGTILQLLAWPLDRSKKLSLWVNHWIWGRMLYAAEVFWTLHRHGYDRIGQGPYIVVCNHGSVLDIPANLTLPLPLRVVGKTSLFKVPLMGWYMQFSRQIPLDAHDLASVEACMDTCRESLEAGISILFFPEGTRSTDGTLGSFNRGAFRLAKDLGVPLLPVVIEGTRKILPKGSLWPSPSRVAVTVQVLDPVDPTPFTTARKFSNQVHEIMRGAMDQLKARQAA